MRTFQPLIGVLLIFFLLLWLGGSRHLIKRLPDGLSAQHPTRVVEANQVAFLFDLTARFPESEGVFIYQEIFDRVNTLIRESADFVLVDFFLINEFAEETWGPPLPPLTSQLAATLKQRRLADPDLPMVLITDPLNTLYHGVENPKISQLEATGIPVVFTQLRKLPDSNIPYSPLWRSVISWWLPKGGGFAVKNPLDEGKVGIGSILELLNFKANHRKVIAVGGTEPKGLVTSANPHTASGLHGNVALQFSGDAVRDLVKTELAVPGMEGRDVTLALQAWIEQQPDYQSTANENHPNTGLLSILTEGKIKQAALSQIETLGQGDRADLALFYFSDIDLRLALEKALVRGAQVRLILDPNKDAFGRAKNGIPNRQIAYYLHKAGADVRWYATGGEQFHSKMAVFHRIAEDEVSLLIGSANWTRRNLNDLNLETNVLLTGPRKFPALSRANDYFEMLWNGRAEAFDDLPPQLTTTLPYEAYADKRLSHRLLYQLMERSGLSTF
jgi:hypothetical protein